MASKPRPQFAPNDPRVIALQKAVKIAGGQAALARMVGISPQGVWWWGICPAERCQQVSQLTGVSVHELRPEVFGAAAINRQEINMDDGFQNVVLRELQRFTEAQMRQALALEEIAGALHRIGVKMKPSHVTAPDQPTTAASYNRAEMVQAARTAAEHAEDEIRRQVETAIAETQKTVDDALAEDERR